MATTKFACVSTKLAVSIAGAGIALMFLASAARADTPNRAGDVKQASQPFRVAALRQDGQAEEIETLGPRNFGPVVPPAEVEFVPVALPQEQPTDELAVVYGHHYYGGYYGGYYGAYYRPYAYAYRPYIYSYSYANYYRPWYYAYPYRYNYAGYYVPNYVSRYVGYYSSPYVGYYSPTPYVGYPYRPFIIAPPVVYGGCYYW